ncbi:MULTISPECIES: HAD family hydrolase [unclassified Nocardioides]|uniref:HAD family hydrolase n=1 Tax=unclassified Nocardioides TaxID=2615069 RepID=UPI00360BD497
MGGVSGVVFDFGNVLIDWQPLAALTAGLGEEEAQRFLTADDFDFMAWNHHQDAGRAWDEAIDELRTSHPHWVRHAEAYLEHFTRSLAEMPGTPDILRDLHGAGVPVLGLTNWSAELYPHAPAAFDFIGLLDVVVVSGREGVAKPDAAAFELVAERSGLPLDRLVFVDDSPRNVDAAAALGMDALLFTGADTLRDALRERGLPV